MKQDNNLDHSLDNELTEGTNNQRIEGKSEKEGRAYLRGTWRIEGAGSERGREKIVD